MIPKCKTVTGQRTFAFHGVKVWNGLGTSTGNAESLDVFKTKLKLDILSKRGLF